MEIHSGSRDVTTLDDPPDRDEQRRFIRSNATCQRGFQAILDRHCNGDRVAFRAWFRQVGLYQISLSHKQKGKDFDIHTGTLAQFMVQWRNSSNNDAHFYFSEMQHG